MRRVSLLLFYRAFLPIVRTIRLNRRSFEKIKMTAITSSLFEL